MRVRGMIPRRGPAAAPGSRRPVAGSRKRWQIRAQDGYGTPWSRSARWPAKGGRLGQGADARWATRCHAGEVLHYGPTATGFVRRLSRRSGVRRLGGGVGREEEEKRSEPYRLGRRRGVRRRLIETYPSIEQMFIKRKPLPAAKRAWLAGVSRPGPPGVPVRPSPSRTRFPIDWFRVPAVRYSSGDVRRGSPRRLGTLD
jgi:hypothetical protein